MEGGGGSPYSPIDRAPPPPPQVPSFFENLNFPSLPFSLPSSYNLEKKPHEFAKKLVSDVVFSLFFWGGGVGQENNHLCILNLEFHIGAFMAPKLNMISAKTLSDFAPFSAVFQNKIAKRGPEPRSQHHPLSMRGNSKIMCPGAQYRRSLWQKKN